MPEKRNIARCKRRLQVRFEGDDRSHIGFTDDVSKDGIFIRTTKVYRPGTILSVRITTKDGNETAFKGQVRWAKKIPASMQHRLKGGMGIYVKSMIEGDELFESFCPIDPCLGCDDIPE